MFVSRQCCVRGELRLLHLDGGGGAARGHPPSGLHGPLAPPFRGAGEHPALGASPAQPICYNIEDYR